ncbi:MAG TPA: ABC-2 family transporter protein [Symbiobacteriaceae bacterium]|nr:ABC-2 family transporter protein [Symbiobacteriaceae bacterium]
MRTIGLYFDLLWLDFQARSQYRVDFFIGIGAAVLQHTVTLATLWVIFGKVPALGGWNGAQAAVLYALFTMAMGLVNLTGSGLRELPGLVEQGELDGLLILPANPYFQLLPRFNPASLGDVLLGVAILVVGAGPAGIQWSPGAVVYCIIAVLCGTAVLLGLLTGLYALAFWVRQPGVTHGVEELTQLARYPTGIYPRWVQILITWIFPVSFASFYPAAVLTRVGSVPLWQGALALPAAGLAAGLGAWLWHRGLRAYEGAGS